MLELTGKCCDAITAVEFFESLAEIIPEDNRTDDFCDEYEQALNRFRYEAAKDIGAKKTYCESGLQAPSRFDVLREMRLLCE